MTDAFVEPFHIEKMRVGRARPAITVFTWVTILIGLSLIPRIASPAVNVTFSTSTPAGFQDVFVGNTTSQYLAGSAPNRFFPSNMDVKIYGLNPNYQPPAVSTTIINLNTIADKLTVISTWTYVYGFAFGQEYERAQDLGHVGHFTVQCSSAGFYGVSTGTWSESVCTSVLFKIYNFIYQQSFSSPTFIP